VVSAGFSATTAFGVAVVVVRRDLRSSPVADLRPDAVRRGPTYLGPDVTYPGEGGPDDVAEDVLLVRAPRDGRPVAHARVVPSPGTATR